jgi:putative transposase
MLELLELSDEDRELAMSRFLVLQPHLEQDRPLRVVAAEAGLAFRTAQRWVAQYRAFGLAALVRKPRGDRGARRIVSETIKTAIEGLALESHPLHFRRIQRFSCHMELRYGEIVFCIA